MRRFALWSALAVVLAFLLGAWTTIDYGLRCTKCLTDQHVVEQRFFGITFARSAKARTPPADYERIFGRPCEHVFRKGGFGWGTHGLLGGIIGCGITGEGMFVEPRIIAIRSVYSAEARLHERDLTLASFELVDRLFPADLNLKDRKSLDYTTPSTLVTFASYLEKAQSVDAWRKAIAEAKDDFSKRRDTVR